MTRALFWAALFALPLYNSLTPCLAQENNRLGRVSDGEISGNTYRNQQLGFSYEYLAGWTVGKATVPEHNFRWKDDSGTRASTRETPRCSKHLLFVTQHPEGMRPDGFVPMASLFVVDPECTSNVTFPKSVADRAAVERFVNLIESHLDTPPPTNATRPRVRPVEYAGRIILQISQSMSVSVHDTSTTTNQNLQLSISAMQSKDYWVVWLFVAANDSEMNVLKATKVFFDDAPSAATGPNKP